LPDNLDAGHPPFFAYYLALCWKLMGRNLVAAHLAMLPALLGILWFYTKLYLEAFGNQRLTYGLLFLNVLCPFAAQIAMVGPDLFLAAGVLILVAGINQQNKLYLAIGIFLCTACSQRGLLLLPIVLIWGLFNKYTFKSYWPIIVGFLPALLYYLYHYYEKGWLGFNPQGEWAGLYATIPFADMPMKMVSFLFRCSDNGLLAVIVLLLIIILYPFRKNEVFSKVEHLALFLGFTGLALIAIITSRTANPISGRYLMPFFLVLTIPASRVFYLHVKLSYLGIAALLLSFSGHFWVYPDAVAKSWDSALAWYPAQNLPLEIDSWLQKNGIQKETVAAEFPLLDASCHTLLNTDSAAYRDRNVGYSPYLLYSNLCNGYSAQELKQMQSWHVLKRWEVGQVYYVLYKWPIYTASIR